MVQRALSCKSVNLSAPLYTLHPSLSRNGIVSRMHTGKGRSEEPSTISRSSKAQSQLDSDASERDALESLDPGRAALQIDQEQRPQSIGGKLKRFFIGDKLDRKRLAALGLGAVASYGFVSNATYGTGMAISWIAFVRNTGKSPLMAGQWKPFLAFFAGFWTLQHFLRPLRLTLALTMAPAFDKILVFLQRQTGWNKRNAFGLYLILFGSTTSFFVFGSIYLFAGPLAFARTVQ